MYLLHRRCGSAQLPEQVTYGVLTNSPVSWLSSPRTAMAQAPSPSPQRHLESITWKWNPLHGPCRQGPGDRSRREEGCRDPSLETRVIYLQTHVYISSYKAASGSKKNLSKNKAKQIIFLWLSPVFRIFGACIIQLYFSMRGDYNIPGIYKHICFSQHCRYFHVRKHILKA